MLRRRPATVEHKGAVDLVTEIDRASEALIRARFAALTPDIPVQGEEEGGQSHGLRWVVDPLDGTTNFVHDYPFYCVSIGLCDGDDPLVGAIYDPVRDRLYTAATGLGAHLAPALPRLADAADWGAPLRVSGTRDLRRALAITGFPYDRLSAADRYLVYVSRALQATQGVRRSGSAALDLAMVAAHSADFFWEFGLHPWDTAAGAVLIREAGGAVTRLDGSPWHPGEGEILASNGWLHEAAIRLLAGG